jgi:hypothetical protein
MAVGIAYILQVLGQNDQFNSLHWFDMVDRYLQQNDSRIKSQTPPRLRKSRSLLSISPMQLLSGRSSQETLDVESFNDGKSQLSRATSSSDGVLGEDGVNNWLSERAAMKMKKEFDRFQSCLEASKMFFN